MHHRTASYIVPCPSIDSRSSLRASETDIGASFPHFKSVHTHRQAPLWCNWSPSSRRTNINRLYTAGDLSLVNSEVYIMFSFVREQKLRLWINEFPQSNRLQLWVWAPHMFMLNLYIVMVQVGSLNSYFPTQPSAPTFPSATPSSILDPDVKLWGPSRRVGSVWGARV